MALEHQSIPGEQFKMICLNNGSPDQGIRRVMLDALERLPGTHREHPVNRGLAAARNAAMRAAQGNHMRKQEALPIWNMGGSRFQGVRTDSITDFVIAMQKVFQAFHSYVTIEHYLPDTNFESPVFSSDWSRGNELS